MNISKVDTACRLCGEHAPHDEEDIRTWYNTARDGSLISYRAHGKCEDEELRGDAVLRKESADALYGRA